MKWILFFLTVLTVFSVISVSDSSQNNDAISKFKHLSGQQLLDTAEYYYQKNYNDTALICYSLIINVPVKDNDIEQQERIIEVYNKSAALYHYMSDYRNAYDFLNKTLFLCEKYNKISYESRIYNNFGNIYSSFKKYDMSELYYLKALDLSDDSVGMVIILNNLGSVELACGKTDSVFYFLNQSLQISKRHNNIHLGGIQNSIALFYEKTKQYDSAFYYFRLALEEAKKNHKIEYEAENLSCLGKLFFEINKRDSALFYIDISSMIATENNFLAILAENHFTLSKIEESKGNSKHALEHFKKYANLKDSIFNVDRFGEINQLQCLYEVSKTNQQIEQLAIEQQIKERTIYYQRIIQFITLIVLLLVSGILLYIFLQKRKLKTAYKVFFEKNLRIIELQKNSSEKYQKSTLTDSMRNELLNKILTLMEDTSIICNTEFSLDKLAELVQSNHAYVSQVINTALKKNFRSFLNSYRVQEAQRLFMELDVAKYTIEYVALQVGFKSSSTFRTTFKEITGVSPNFYLKSIREQCRE